MQDLLQQEAMARLVALPERVAELDKCFREEITGIKVSIAQMKASMRMMFMMGTAIGTVIGSIIGGVIVAIIVRAL